MAGAEVVLFSKDGCVRNDGMDKEMTGKRGEMKKRAEKKMRKRRKRKHEQRLENHTGRQRSRKIGDVRGKTRRDEKSGR